MVAIDLRDQAQSRGHARWFADLLERATGNDAGTAVLRAAVIADVLAVAAALSIGIAGYGMLPPWAMVAIGFGWPLAVGRVGGYNRRRLLGHPIGWAAISTGAARLMMACVIFDLVFGTPGVRVTLAVIAIIAALTTLGRAVVSAWLRFNRRRGRLRSYALVRGTLSDVLRFISSLNRDPSRPLEVVAAQITDGAAVDAFGDLTLVPCSKDPIDAAVRNHASSLVILGPPDMTSDALRRIIWQAQSSGIEAHILPIVEPVAPPSVAAVGGGVPLLSFQGPNRQLQSLKVVMDRGLAAVGLLALSPALVGIALAVKVTSRGPVLFRQVRVGHNCQPFTMLKFRTMCEGAEKMQAQLAELNTHTGGTLFKVRRDPRVTSVGRVLRRYSLDELPQLVNVARGEMSLVGPRPPLPNEVANYPADSMRRFIVRPGLTGLWQVSGRSDIDPVESARLDTLYVENWTLEMDLRILARTAKAVVSGSGAY